MVQIPIIELLDERCKRCMVNRAQRSVAFLTIIVHDILVTTVKPLILFLFKLNEPVAEELAAHSDSFIIQWLMLLLLRFLKHFKHRHTVMHRGCCLAFACGGYLLSLSFLI